MTYLYPIIDNDIFISNFEKKADIFNEYKPMNYK